MAKAAFVTGITGQDGAYLAQLLLQRGYRVLGQTRNGELTKTARLAELGVASDVEIIPADIFDLAATRQMLERLCPDEVYNLAGSSSVARSFEQPMLAMEANAIGAARLLEAIRLSGAGVRFFQCSTSEMFGVATAPIQDEATPFRPRSPYAVAKLFAHWQTVSYRESYRMFAACGVMFNHESPLRSQQFVTRKITAQLAEVKHGRRERLSLGNLDVQRDWGFAGDHVNGMWRALQPSEPRDFVFATGVSTSVRSFTERAAAALGMAVEWKGSGASEIGIDRKTGRTVIEVSAALFRPADLSITVGDATRARNELGWRPSVDIDGLIDMMATADERRLLENRPLD